MRIRTFIVVPLAAFLLLGAGLPNAAHAQAFRGNAMPADAAANVKQLIVTYKDGPKSATAQAANAKVGTIFVRPMGSGDAAVVTLPPDADVDQAIATFEAQPGVTHVEINARKTVDPIRGPRLDK
jgi:hypothetical protein